MNTNRKEPTISDVAALAKVSTATVSRCLNAPERVSPDTREAVLSAVQTLGYMPNFGARALVARRTNTVGAIIPTMDNAIFARGLQAFQETLHEQGVTLLVASSQYDPAQEEEQIRTLLARGADGLLLIGYERSADLKADLARRGVPSVVAWAYDPDTQGPAVGFDNRRAMGELATEVLMRGHRHLSVISAVTATNDRARERVAGVRAAMAAQGLDPATLRVEETHYAFESGARALARLMASEPRPTAVICGNDVLAIGAIREARKMGLRVPEDLSVTGFDDIELASIAEPALTTVHVPHREMGRAAARALLGAIKGEDTVQSVELPTELRIRGTLGPVKPDVP